jgi:hypothetical protein
LTSGCKTTKCGISHGVLILSEGTVYNGNRVAFGKNHIGVFLWENFKRFITPQHCEFGFHGGVYM